MLGRHVVLGRDMQRWVVLDRVGSTRLLGPWPRSIGLVLLLLLSSDNCAYVQ